MHGVTREVVLAARCEGKGMDPLTKQAFAYTAQLSGSSNPLR